MLQLFLPEANSMIKLRQCLQQLIQKEPANSKNYFYLGENYLADYFADTISNSLTVAAKAAKEIISERCRGKSK